MNDIIRVFSGRTFSTEDIELIKWLARVYPTLSRYEFAGTVCESLNWTTTRGGAKYQQCLDFLGNLEAEGIVKPPAYNENHRKTKSNKIEKINFNETEVSGDLQNFEEIFLRIAQPGESLKRWKAYINQYHMLGYKTTFGSKIKYFVKSGEMELGCMQFSASSWALEEREKWIGWNTTDRKSRLHLIVNNSRFLIFPWVKIKNLASKALSLAAKQIQKDWLHEYCYAPVLLETFVDLEYFKGTGYKAANWIYLGKTKGRGRMDRNNKKALSKKAIFVYPLQSDFRECLCGEKPYKEVDPDEC